MTTDPARAMMAALAVCWLAPLVVAALMRLRG